MNNHAYLSLFLLVLVLEWINDVVSYWIALIVAKNEANILKEKGEEKE